MVALLEDLWLCDYLPLLEFVLGSLAIWTIFGDGSSILELGDKLEVVRLNLQRLICNMQLELSRHQSTSGAFHGSIGYQRRRLDDDFDFGRLELEILLRHAPALLLFLLYLMLDEIHGCTWCTHW